MKNESKQINKISKIGFGGGCHWCTEAVFQSLKGVVKVEQGWIKSSGYATNFSEAVIVHYIPKKITLDSLIEIHLLTHSSTSDHSMREKYRSAVYYFSKKQKENTDKIILNIQGNFKRKIITKTCVFKEFRASLDNYQDYYQKNPNKPFCKRYIQPKLKIIKSFSDNKDNLFF